MVGLGISQRDKKEVENCIVLYCIAKELKKSSKKIFKHFRKV